MHVGDKVKVRSDASIREGLKGLTGTVRKVWSGVAQVELDTDWEDGNQRYFAGYRKTFNIDHLTVTEKAEDSEATTTYADARIHARMTRHEEMAVRKLEGLVESLNIAIDNIRKGRTVEYLQHEMNLLLSAQFALGQTEALRHLPEIAKGE